MPLSSACHGYAYRSILPILFQVWKSIFSGSLSHFSANVVTWYVRLIRLVVAGFVDLIVLEATWLVRMKLLVCEWR